MEHILNKIAALLEQRKQEDPDNSYVASLYEKGVDEILKKLGEEATELIISAKNNDNRAIIHEMADLWFHTLVLLSFLEIEPEHIFKELEARFGISGLKEKANRSR